MKIENLSRMWVQCRRTIRAVLVAAVCATTGLTQQPQALLQITSPPDGTLAYPGQTVIFVVTPQPGITATDVFVSAPDPIGYSTVAAAAPFQVSLRIPTLGDSGRYPVVATGFTAQGELVDSHNIYIVVESPNSPLKLVAAPAQIAFEARGEQIPLQVTGTFSNGQTMDLTESSDTTYASSNVSVATVDGHGMITAAGPGNAQVVVRNGNLSVTVPVSFVTGPAITISVSPSTLWPPNGKMTPVTISGTVQSTGRGVRPGSGRYQVNDEYGTVQPKGTVALGGDSSYSLTVLLEASRRGDDLDGRQYTIVVSAKDALGRPGSEQTVVIVPHDQGK